MPYSGAHGDDGAVGDGGLRGRDRRDEGGGVGNHQQRGEPAESVPGPGNDARCRHERHPPPVVGGIRAQPGNDPDQWRYVHHPACPAKLCTKSAPQYTHEQRRDAQLAHQRADQDGREHHADEHRDEQMEQSTTTRRPVRRRLRSLARLTVPEVGNLTIRHAHLPSEASVGPVVTLDTIRRPTMEPLGRRPERGLDGKTAA